MQEQLHVFEDQRSKFKCQACDEANPAISRCSDCDHFLCRECHKAHQRLSLMKSHKIYTLARHQSGKISDGSRPREDIPKCQKHPDQNLSIYCKTCELLVCAVCSVTEHGPHSRSGLAKSLGECKQAIAELTTEGKEILTEAKNAKIKIEQTHEQLKELLEDINRTISTKFDQMVTKLRQKECKLKEAVYMCYQKKVKTFEIVQTAKSKEVWEVQHKLDEVNKHMSEASSYDILRLKQKHLQNLRLLIQTRNEQQKVPESLFNLTEFVESVRLLERESQINTNGEDANPVSTWGMSPEEGLAGHGSLSPQQELQRARTMPPEEKARLLERKEVQRPVELPEGPSSRSSLEKEAQRPPSLPVNNTPEVSRRSASVHLERAPSSQIRQPQEERLAPHPEVLPPKVKWQLKTTVKTFGSWKRADFKFTQDVAAFSNSEIVTVDIIHKQLIKILPVRPRSHVVSQKLKINGLVDQSSRVVVNKLDQLIVLVGSVIKIFDREYQFLRQFVPGSPGSDSNPTCLAVDQNNLIAVGFADKGEIALHNPDGSLVKTLPAPLISAYLTICKQKLVYTNWDRKKIVSVDYNGQTVFSTRVTSPSLQGPTGVCSCEDGSFYVAIQGFVKGIVDAEIHHCTPDGKNFTPVISERSCPYGLTLTRSGELVVAAKRSVQIYRRVVLTNSREPNS